MNLPKNLHPQTVFITEPGLYALITKSTKPEAITFSTWVYEVVLPSLRKNIFQEYLEVQRPYIEEEINELREKYAEGFVYIATSDDWQDIFKVGCTQNPSATLSLLNSSSPSEIYFVYESPLCKYRYREKYLCHELIRKYHHRLDFFKIERKKLLEIIERHFKGLKC